MQTYTHAEIASWERFYRANFINSLCGFKSASLIGTRDKEGKPNLGIFSSIVHIGSDPALIGYINRPRAAAPHTLANIEATGVYTMNHIHPGFTAKAHQTSAKYSKDVSEFDETGLTPEYIDNFPAPFVSESRVKYALRVEEIMPITLNGTFLVIGKVQAVFLKEGLLQPDGYIELQAAETICCNGLDGYYKTTQLGRYAYAKPGRKPSLLFNNE